MKQIILAGAEARLARVPRPAIAPGSVIVQVHYSLISSGTELAGLRSAITAEATFPIHGAVGLLSKAPSLLKKAILHPDIALDRLRQLSSSRASSIRRRLFPSPRPSGGRVPVQAQKLTGAAVPISWKKLDALTMSPQEAGLEVLVGGKPGSYQVEGEPIAIAPTDYLRIRVSGKASGANFDIGVLDSKRERWLSTVRLVDEFDEELLVDPGNEEFVWVVLSLGDIRDANGVLSLTSATVEAIPKWEVGSLHNDMTDIGWNVGYSVSGQIVAVADDVLDLSVGDLVACGGAGQANHAEFVQVKKNLVARLPAGCPPDLAASTTVGAIALQGVRRADLRLNEVVCVVGLGLLGLITCQLAKASGCKVLGLDLSADRVARAKLLGVDFATTSPDDLLHLATHSTHGHGADVTIITAATKSDFLVNHAMRTTRRKGRVVIVGDIGLGIERTDFYKKEIDLLISSSYGPGRYDPSYENLGHDYPYAYVRWTMNRNMAAYLDLIVRGSINVRALIDRIVNLDDAPEMYGHLARQEGDGAIGVLIRYPSHAQVSPVPETLITLSGHRRAKKNRIGYVLVGAGAFGQSMLVPQMDRRQDLFDLRGVVSRDAIRGGNFARQRQLPLLGSRLEDVLDRDDVDLVVIATRHSEHASQVSAALRAGKHVFVEKPLALTWDELDSVRSAFQERQHGALLMVGFNRRFAPAIEAIRTAMDQRVGPVIINYRLSGGFISRENWVQGSEGGGRNLGEACHMYDTFRALIGAPVSSVSASAIDPGQTAYMRNDNFIATLTYEDGSLASLIYTANGPKSGLPKERIEVFCDGKAYVVDNFLSTVAYPEGAVLWQSAETADKGHFTELVGFGEAITSGLDASPIPVEEIFETTGVALHIEDLLQGRV